MVLYTTQDINVSIKSTLFENIPAPLLHRVCSVLKLVLLCSCDASASEIVFADIQKH